jgi:hypothetical protein
MGFTKNKMRLHVIFMHFNKKPECSHCEKYVLKPEDLVRHFGMNFHKTCFKEYYPSVTGLNENEKSYFDRIYSLVVLGKRAKLF